jgi:hypothetical protein
VEQQLAQTHRLTSEPSFDLLLAPEPPFVLVLLLLPYFKTPQSQPRATGQDCTPRPKVKNPQTPPCHTPACDSRPKAPTCVSGSKSSTSVPHMTVRLGPALPSTSHSSAPTSCSSSEPSTGHLRTKPRSLCAESFDTELWRVLYTGGAAGGFACSCCRALVLLLLLLLLRPLQE